MSRLFLFEGDYELGLDEKLTHLIVYLNRNNSDDIFYECMIGYDEDNEEIIIELFREIDGKWYDINAGAVTNVSQKIGEIIDANFDTSG